jgi:RNA polymerase sigma-70 factor (ECF subfamily)
MQQAAIIERSVAGQLPPFDAVFQRYYNRVFTILTRIVGPDEADDLAQETFLRFHDRPPIRQSDNEDAIGAWLYRVATNLGFNALRTRKRRTAREERVTRAELPLQRPLDPEHETVRREERALVQSVLVAMPERARAVLTLRQAGCSYAEIAAAVGIAPGSVGTTLVRAETLFRQRYEAVHDRRTAGA